MMRIAFFLILNTSLIYAQTFAPLTPPLRVNGHDLLNGFAGGVGIPRISEIKLNDDSLMDMLVFEAFGARIMPYIAVREGQRIVYQYAPDRIPDFPEMYNWVLARDYNKDGIEDLFASSALNQGPLGIEVYTGQQDGTYRLYDPPTGRDNILYYRNNGGLSQIYAPYDDIPVIEDVDGDGDLDILSFESTGGSVYYFRNTAVENGKPLDTLMYELDDLCWGKFFESISSSAISYSDNPNECASGLKEQDPSEGGGPGAHSGSTLLVFDQDHDGDMELLLGDVSANNLVFMTNNGTPERAWMEQEDVNFPSYDQPVQLETFVAAYMIDANQDGQKDLVVSTNKRVSQDVKGQWYYVGYQNNGKTYFSFEFDDFLGESMLDMGTGCRPFLVDYNADGLLDIVAGNEYLYTDQMAKGARLYLLENVGTKEMPAFEMINDDYLGLLQFSNNSSTDNLIYYTPAFGDIDGDGDKDCLVGTIEGRLIFLENIAGPGQIFRFQTPVMDYMGIDVGGKAVPFIYDVNYDGLGDIVLGQETNQVDQDGLPCGSMHYFENTGSTGDARFDSDPFAGNNTPCFGRQIFRKYGSEVDASPYIYELTNGQPRLYLGTNQGIKVMDDISAHPDAQFDLIDEQFGGFYTDENHHVALGDLNNDGILEVILGHKTGGMTLYSTDHGINGSVATRDVSLHEIQLVSNPVSKEVTLVGAGGCAYLLYNLQGQPLSQGKYNQGVDVQFLPPGVYLLRVQKHHHVKVFKILKK